MQGLAWNTELPTTFQRTILGVTQEGVLYGQGELPVLRSELAPGFSGFQGKELSSLAFFLHMTDTHSTDEESPVTLHYRRCAGYSPQILDAHVAVARKIADQAGLDFILHTGDACEDAQKNEFEWFLAGMDGGALSPNSGAAVEPGGRFAGPENQPFFTKGLAGIPWYFTMGNHDELVMGSLTPTEALKELAVGGFAPIGYETPLPFSIPFLGPSLPIELRGAAITPDPNRRILTREELLTRLLASPSSPPGHGYTASNTEGKARYYATDPIPGVPLRILALDTASPIGYSLGSIRQEQFEWLRNSLEEAVGQGMLVLIATHHPSGSITDLPPLEGLRSKNGNDLTELLNAYPNVLAHIAGHTHVNVVTAKKAYYEVQTCAGIDPPQQTRAFEILWDGEEHVALVTAMVDFEETGGLADEGRLLAFSDPLSRKGPGSIQDRNTLCVLRVTQDFQENLRKASLRPSRLLCRG
jgi:3',5'-cyclic AMP phosphodiesterase CpdA